jgi:hypothetical protein
VIGLASALSLTRRFRVWKSKLLENMALDLIGKKGIRNDVGRGENKPFVANKAAVSLHIKPAANFFLKELASQEMARGGAPQLLRSFDGSALIYRIKN